MYTVQYGGKAGQKFSLKESDSLLAVRTVSRRAAVGPPQEAAPLSPDSLEILSEFEVIEQFPVVGVEVFRASKTRGAKSLRDSARQTLKQDKAVRFAGRVLIDPKSKAPVLYTENCFVKFHDDVKLSEIKKLLKKHSLKGTRKLGYARNAWDTAAPEGIGLDVFELAAQLLQEAAVELAHPELIRRISRKAVFASQWHLFKTRVGTKDVDAHANVEEAWSLADGTGVTIAIIDDGVDLDHEEFRSSGKVFAPRDVTLGTDNPRPGPRDRHGTACAGVACADGNFGASGVAPRARLIPIRFASGLGSQAEADAFVWAAQNGADVISCSWGPVDGEWFNPNDPQHDEVTLLPDSTRLAMDFAVTQGRNGKGCVICFAAGNGNENVGNDGYASYEKVIAVAACNDVGKKSVYSDFGDAIWCSFPSNELDGPRLTPGIWTTDNSGPPGYNPGQKEKGDLAGNYTNGFGGTSSACPGAAGVAALVLSRNPALRWDEVREILKTCCDKIDTKGGDYDANGHSLKYGFGRLNARRAVELAVPAPPPEDRIVTATAAKDVVIRDFKTAKLSLQVAETAKLKELKVTVDIEHTYIGDLLVTLTPPKASGAAAIVLHDHAGGSQDNLRTTYDAVNLSALAALVGASPEGTWTLTVKDTAKIDEGRIRSLSLEMRL